MKTEWIDIMKKTGRLKLSFWDSFTHYAIVLMLLIPFIITLFDYLKYFLTGSYYGIRTPNELFLINLPFTCAGIIFFFIQYFRLRFKTIETSLTREKLGQIITKTAKELEWQSEINNHDFIIKKTNPKWWSGSWGERIVIIFDDKRLLINSICDPDKKASIVSIGRNRKNVNRLIENIKSAGR